MSITARRAQMSVVLARMLAQAVKALPDQANTTPTLAHPILMFDNKEVREHLFILKDDYAHTASTLPVSAKKGGAPKEWGQNKRKHKKR